MNTVIRPPRPPRALPADEALPHINGIIRRTLLGVHPHLVVSQRHSQHALGCFQVPGSARDRFREGIMSQNTQAASLSKGAGCRLTLITVPHYCWQKKTTALAVGRIVSSFPTTFVHFHFFYSRHFSCCRSSASTSCSTPIFVCGQGDGALRSAQHPSHSSIPHSSFEREVKAEGFEPIELFMNPLADYVV